MSSQTSKFVYAMNASASTWNGAVSLSTPDPSGESSGRVGLFFKSVRGLDAPRQYQFMVEAARENIVDAFLIGFHIRDCRGGKGERELGRRCLIWLFINHPILFSKVAKLLPEYGRWDDVLQFFPGVLDLTDIDSIRVNCVSTVSNTQHLSILNTIQCQMVQLMGLQLQDDKKNMLSGMACQLTAKWAPTEGDSLDRKTGVFNTLANEMRISTRTLRKNYITPLREYLKVVEHFMCKHEWDKIDYSMVPSCAMKRLKNTFENNDVVRFKEWRDALTKNEPNGVKVCANQLMPYELVREMRTSCRADEVCEAQWRVLEEECRKNCSLDDDVVVVDTSGSMHSPNYIPLDVAVSMGLLISSCSTGKFKNIVFTFNDVPEVVTIKEGSIYDRWRQVNNIKWGGSTNIQATFELILSRGKLFKLEQNDMPKRLWIVSDMQFNEVNGYSGSTNFEAIDKMYIESGYTRPQIIFWNVNGESDDFPVSVGDNGTALISGFSPSVMKAVLDNDKSFSPYSIMRNTLDSNRLLPVREALRVKTIDDDKQNE